MAARKTAKTVVSLTRTSAKLPSMATDYAPFCRALWNMGDAAETATGGNAFYARKRDEILATLTDTL